MQHQASWATCPCCAAPRKSGLGSAYRAGFAWGLERGYEAFVEIDADFSHDPTQLPSLLAAAEAALTWSSVRATCPVARSRTGRGAGTCCHGRNRYASAVLGLHVADSTAGFRVYRASLLDRVELDSVRAEGYGFQIEMTYRARQAGATICEVPIRFVDRVEGESKMSSMIVVEALGLVTLWGRGGLSRRPPGDRAQGSRRRTADALGDGHARYPGDRRTHPGGR